MTQTILNLATSFANGPVITQNNFKTINKVEFKKWLAQNLDKMSDKTRIEAESYITPITQDTDNHRQRRLIANSTRAFI